MAFIDWTDDYSVKVHLIDRQHQKLFELVNGYHNAVLLGHTETALIQLLDGLYEYATIHFGTEERYFIQFNYKETAAHKREHQILAIKINDLKSKVKVGINIEDDEVSKFLKIWLDTHIKETDHKYIECFQKGGLR
jgi:hemerythrin-like metal-binding protein